MSAQGNGAFLEYHESDIVSILTLISFFFFLAVSAWVADKVLRAGLIGQIIVGLIYGVPIGNILALKWQETLLALGYIGLIIIIFEGGLTIRLDLLWQNLFLSTSAALLGVLTPIALTFALFYAGFGYAPLKAFITRVGTVLISAAILDDVCDLVLVSVISQLRDIENANLGWVIGRPILASGLMAILTPLAAKFFGHVANMVLMVLVLCAFLAIAAYARASVLFGAFLAGTVVSSLPSKQHVHFDEPSDTTDHDDVAKQERPTFGDIFDRYIQDAQRFILQPCFFPSIGFSIPFIELWTGEVIWKGIAFTILMVLGKLVVGLVIPLWDLVANKKPDPSEKALLTPSAKPNWVPAAFLGTAMVARGEIGLLIIQIGLNETPYLSRKAFVIAVWAIVLNTVIGPVSVGTLLNRFGSAVAGDRRWGIQAMNPRRQSQQEA
ncbi:Sodium/hydrogen exchanger family-domain-containing protein [Pseudoneurospora amorphoporcata]|uniref:Sodium/hydrogen exchanger family-domain-containing protein n=1 Tax=Pseudoneurospora amorphoporcata TaxID=241081 RepID=A0AAN6SBM3_9PEZI|nr:Sodium/hydrogen exchanger family-domain-containing protein [Pseudoneurospora amorphoporcata]